MVSNVPIKIKYTTSLASWLHHYITCYIFYCSPNFNNFQVKLEVSKIDEKSGTSKSLHRCIDNMKCQMKCWMNQFWWWSCEKTHFCLIISAALKVDQKVCETWHMIIWILHFFIFKTIKSTLFSIKPDQTIFVSVSWYSYQQYVWYSPENIRMTSWSSLLVGRKYCLLADCYIRNSYQYAANDYSKQLGQTSCQSIRQPLHYGLAKDSFNISLIASFTGPTWGPSGADRTQVGPMLAPWTLLFGIVFHFESMASFKRRSLIR